MKRLMYVLALLAFAFVQPVTAVTLFEDSSPGDTKGWGTFDTRPGGSVGYAPFSSDGDGSVALTRDATTASKAGFGTVWDPDSNKYGVTTYLDDIGTWSFDFYRSSDHQGPANQSPAMRINFITSNGKAGALVWEHAYQGLGDTPTNMWETVDVSTAKLWLRFDGVNYDNAADLKTLAEWQTPGVKPGGADLVDAKTLSLQISMGSGVSDEGTSNIDHVIVGFNGGDTVVTNFAVPEPSGALLTALCGCFAFLRRRRR